MKILRRACGLSGVLLLILVKALPSAADPYATCLGEIAKAHLEIKTAYQNAFRDLIVARNPELEELADLNRDVQVLAAQMRFAHLDYLLTTAPERVDGNSGLASFQNYNWTPQDRDRLTAASARFREQSEQLDLLEGEHHSHSDWPDMYRFVRSEMSDGGGLAQVTADFNKGSAALEARLAGCQEN